MEIKQISELRAGTEAPEYFSLPAARVIGRGLRCVLDMNLENPIPAFWGKCDDEGALDKIDTLPKLFPAKLGFTDDFDAETNTFTYMISALTPAGTEVPEGFSFRDIPETIVFKGKYGDWLEQSRPIWEGDGFEWSGAPGQYWNAELYLDGEPHDGFRLLCAVHKK